MADSEHKSTPKRGGMVALQIETLHNVARGCVDAIRESEGDAAEALLAETVAPCTVTAAQACDFLRRHSELLEQQLQVVAHKDLIDRNLLEVRNDWRTLAARIESGQQVDYKDPLFKRLSAHPTHDPICLVAVHIFEVTPFVLEDENSRDSLNHLRELYLEVSALRSTTQHVLVDDELVEFEVCSRMGLMPLNLDHYGLTPMKGEIQTYISCLVSESVQEEQYRQRVMSEHIASCFVRVTQEAQNVVHNLVTHFVPEEFQMQVLQKNPLDRVAAARVYQQVEQGIRRLREEQQAAAKADRERSVQQDHKEEKEGKGEVEQVDDKKQKTPRFRRHCAIMVSSAQFQPQLQPGECITKLLVLCVGAGGGSGWCTGGGGSGYYRTILFAAVDGSPGLLFSVVSSKNAKRQVFNPKHGVPVIVGLPRKGNAGSSSLFGDFLIAEGGQGTCFFSDTTGRSGGSGAGASQTSAVGRLLFKLGKGGCAGGHGQRTAFASGGTGQGAVPDLSVFQLHKLRYGDAGSGDDKFATGAGGVEIEGFPVPSNCASQPAALVQHGRGFGAGAGEVASGIASGASGLVYIEWESVIPLPTLPEPAAVSEPVARYFVQMSRESWRTRREILLPASTSTVASLCARIVQLFASSWGIRELHDAGTDKETPGFLLSFQMSGLRVWYPGDPRTLSEADLWPEYTYYVIRLPTCDERQASSAAVCAGCVH